MIIKEIIEIMNKEFDHYLFIINRPEAMEEKVVLIPFHHHNDHDDNDDDHDDHDHDDSDEHDDRNYHDDDHDQ